MSKNLVEAIPNPVEMNPKVKTALVLASIALAFFLGIIAKYWLLNG